MTEGRQRRDQGPSKGLLTIYVASAVGLAYWGAESPVVAGVLLAVVVNLLAAELDRSGRTVGFAVVRAAGWLLPARERANWVEQWEDHVVTAGSEGLRPVLAAWHIALVAAPALALAAQRRALGAGPSVEPMTPAAFSQMLDRLQGALKALVKTRARRQPDVDLETVSRALALSANVHRDQRRISGEPFVSHPANVAATCLDAALGTDVVAAALLHHACDSGMLNQREIRADFGPGVAALVDAERRLRDPRAFHEVLGIPLPDQPGWRPGPSLGSPELGAAILRLFGRLHNLRTIGVLPKRRQQAIAIETLDVYVPVAEYLGIGGLTEHLKDHSLRALDERSYAEAHGRLDLWRREHGQELREQCQHAARELDALGIQADVDWTLDDVHTTHNCRLQRGGDWSDFNPASIRILVGPVKDCYGAAGAIHNLWPPIPGQFEDLIATPRPSGYQAVHTTIAGPHERPVRVRIQTYAMAAVAMLGPVLLACTSHWLDYEEVLAMDWFQDRRRLVAAALSEVDRASPGQ